MMQTNFFRNDNFLVFLIGCTTEIFHTFLKIKALFRRQALEALWCAIAVIDIDSFLEVTLLWDSPSLPKYVQKTISLYPFPVSKDISIDFIGESIKGTRGRRVLWSKLFTTCYRKHREDE